MNRFNVRKVGVLGAGVMGAQISAHLVNMGIPVVLFDLAAKEGPKNAISSGAIEKLKKLKPAPLATASKANLIHAANYDEDMALLGECDLVIEAIAEKMEWKHDLYTRIASHLAPHAILASNTSGLSINELSQALPDSVKPRFCGIHFFNPPRYMHLIELIPTRTTDADVVEQLETIAVTLFGKGVVKAKDTPNFVANRIGVAGVVAVMAQAEKFNVLPEVVDQLTGKYLGRASSGTYRTADVVGLDIMPHVIATMSENLPDDPFHSTYKAPKALSKLLENGALGQKTGAGFFKKVKRDILRFDLDSGEYVPADSKADKEVIGLLRLPAPERLKQLRESTNPEAQFVWAVLRDGFHYAAVHLESIAESARDIDLSMRWGFGYKQGPFELWQEAGWTQVANWIKEDIDAGKALCDAPLPAWVFEGPVPTKGIHTPEGSWNPETQSYTPRSALPVYDRQLFPEDVQGSDVTNPLTSGTELYRNPEVRAWTLDNEVVIVSILSKLHILSPAVVEGLSASVKIAEQSYKGMVIWSPDDVFSAGANLDALLKIKAADGMEGVADLGRSLHAAMLSIRYAQVPVVAAMRGLALGGGCELAVHCARRVSTMETYMGLVEVGVGLIPAGGGLTYIARRAAETAQAANATSDFLKFLHIGFGNAATAKVSSSALEAKEMGFMLEDDIVVPNRDELLHVAITQAKAMFDSSYRAPDKVAFPIAGRDMIATFKAQMVNMRDGGFISEHDFHICSRIADVVCGGDVDSQSLVTEEYLMGLEMKHFGELLEHPKTQERITGMLKTGKPVRN